MKKGTVDKASQNNRDKNFVQNLLHWNLYDNTRQMPWKGEKDPYKIWLSEIILQQTRVEQGLKYYQQFIKTFPNVETLAKARETKVFKQWEGLGYYSRCRNLIQAANYIVNDLKGVFPAEYDAILSLKGVGSYTASAIASFAYNHPYAVLDGNVFRVLSRVFNIDVPIDTTRGKKAFSALAQGILPLQQAGEYNQAIMDFGAVICKPLPVCEECFFNKDCLAYLAGRQDLLPVKEKKLRIRERWLNYFIVKCADEVLIRQRTEKDIWQGLHQFVLVETEKGYALNELKILLQKQYGLENYVIENKWKKKQMLSHQSICFQFVLIKIKRKRKIANYTWTPLNHLQQIAFPRTLQQAIHEYLV